MKKNIILMAATSALMLTACTSEEDVLQTGQLKQTAPQEVGFDVYTPAATSITRAGLQGTMTTNRLQRSEFNGGGFGVYAFLTEDSKGGEGDASANADAYTPTNPATDANVPDFMVNEKILWNATNQGWYYNPLKYWPNETDYDSQNTPAWMENDHKTSDAYDKMHLDRLTFFAYAPYVPTTTNVTVPGITNVTDEKGKLNGNKTSDPTIGYKASIDNPNKAVDLLWGVAPAGGLTYSAVNGRTVNIAEGLPLIDMTKPDVNTNMKFLFQHALARIGVTAVAAIDQVGAGGNLDPNTRITIEKITLTGYFGETGDLNLNNTTSGPGVANWISANGKAIKGSDLTGSGDKALVKTELILQADHSDTPAPESQYIATHLQFVGTHASPAAQTDRVGVTTVRQNVIQPAEITATPWVTSKYYNANELAYSETTPYYKDASCSTLAGVTMPASYTIDNEGKITENAAGTEGAFKYPKVLENYEMSTTFTKVTSEDEDKYENYKAYTQYRKIEAAPTDDGKTYVYDNTSKDYVKVTDENKAGYNSPVVYQAYEKVANDKYIPKEGKPLANDYIVKDGLYFYELTDDNKADFAGSQLYSHAGSVYTPLKEGATPEDGNFVACGQKKKVVPYYPAATYYKRDANYFMVVPTNNFKKIEETLDEEKLRTVRVMIEYYITTEDSKVAGGRTQTKNVIEKDVLFPSLANGKSYNLNLVLGLTSVKMEAEVDDWKVINVQADLPQNTAE